MRLQTLGLAGLLLLPLAVHAQDGDRKYLPMPSRPGAPPAAFSNGVLVGNTLYVSGHISNKPSGSPEADAKVALDGIKSAVEEVGMTMDDLVWVQVFCDDLTLYDAFNGVYRTYFKGPLPARAFLGTDHLLYGSHFEVMGIAVKPKG